MTAPTAWWCPDCGSYFAPYSTLIRSKAHSAPGGTHRCHGPMITVPLLTPGLSLADLAVLLARAGFDVRVGYGDLPDDDDWWADALLDSSHTPVLVVAAKEPEERADRRLVKFEDEP